MVDNCLQLFDGQAILDGNRSPLIATVKLDSPVAALAFSTLDTYHLMAGCQNGDVILLDCSDPKHPVTTKLQTSSNNTEITAVAWNTAVSHICAVANYDGTVLVFDVTAKSLWCEIRAEHSVISSLCWNPAQGLHLLTVSGDDRNPVLKVWDLGASTTVPLATLNGHSSGLFQASWCPHDDSFLLTCAKDNRTLLWDLNSLSAVAELPMDAIEAAAVAKSNSASNLFSQKPGLSQQQQLRYLVLWSPFQRGICITCSLDRKVQIHSISGLALQRPPAWMQPGPPVTTGFGGALLTTKDQTVVVRTVTEQPVLVQVSQSHETDLQSHEIIDFCKVQQEKASQISDKAIWGFMQVVFEANARQELLLHLGLDAEQIAQAAQNNDLTTNGGSATVKDGMTPEVQNLVKESLLVGNFEAAVDCCLRAESYGDALVLASCGGGDLWAKTQEQYFASQTTKRPYLTLLSGIVGNQMDEIVNNGSVESWQETLAVISTYSEAEEFSRLCVQLGDKLNEAGEDSSANLCYMCALNLERAVDFWQKQLKDKVGDSSNFKSTKDLLALHEFVAKASVFTQAVGPSAAHTPDMDQSYAAYAQALAEQGLLVTAAKYCNGNSENIMQLRDRLYRSRSSQQCFQVLGSAPDFPYQMVSVEQSRGQVMSQPIVPQPESNGTAEHQFEQPGHVSDELPEGWIALQDPASGNTYYANENTGEVSWDKPAVTPAPAPSQVQYPAAAQTQYPSQQTNNTATFDQGAQSAYPAQTSYHGQDSYPNQSNYTSQAQYPQTIQNSYPAQDQLDTSQRSQLTSQSAASKATTQSAASKPKSSLVSKYGDGFVSSSSNPELAYQYGNVGTSNPYGSSNRPGTAAAVIQTPPRAPVSGSLNFDSIQLSDTHAHMKDILLGLSESLKVAHLNPVEKRQMGEAEKGIAILVKKLARSEVDDDAVQQVSALVSALSMQDFGSAVAIQAGLANTHWRQDKDWLKGIKILVQLASKKF